MAKTKEVFSILILVLILAAVIPAAVFICNLAVKNAPISIDDKVYKANLSTLAIYPKTDEYADKIELFYNLEALTISPLKYNVGTIVISGSEEEVLKEFEIEKGTWTNVDDLSCLASLTGLTYLNIHNCSVSSIDFVRENKNLKTLIINDTQVSDISVLKNNHDLETINISSCPINDYSALTYCENLEHIYADTDQIPQDIVNILRDKNVSIHFNS